MAENAQNATVVCKRCERPITLSTPGKVADEFAVTCPKCGQRGIFHRREIKTTERR